MVILISQHWRVKVVCDRPPYIKYSVTFLFADKKDQAEVSGVSG